MLRERKTLERPNFHYGGEVWHDTERINRRLSKTGSGSGHTARRRRSTTRRTRQPREEEIRSQVVDDRSDTRGSLAQWTIRFVVRVLLGLALLEVALRVVQPFSISSLFVLPESTDTAPPPALTNPTILAEISTDDFCDYVLRTSSNSSLLGDDPSGLLAVVKLLPRGTGKKLRRMSDDFTAMSREARQLELHTKSWTDQLGGTPLRHRAEEYTYTQGLINSNLWRLCTGYENFVGSVSGSVGLLQSNLQSKISLYNNETYQEANRPHSWFSNPSRIPPLGDAKQLFRIIGLRQLGRVHQLVQFTQSMVEYLEKAQSDLRSASRKFEEERFEWTRMCGSVRVYNIARLIGLSSTFSPAGCSKLNAEGARQILQGSKPRVEKAKVQLQELIYSLRSLECRYRSMAGDPRAKTEEEHAQFETLQGYQYGVSKISKNLKSAVGTFKLRGDAKK